MQKIFIETPRLYIRTFLPEDAPAMFEMDSDAEVHRYVGRNPVTSIAEVAKVIDYVRQQYIDHGIGRWAVVEKATDKFIGWTGFKLLTEPVNGHKDFYDFGYRFRRDKWRQGFGLESGRAALDYGLQLLGNPDVYAMTDVDNIASRSLLERLGFRFQGLFDYDGPPGWREDKEPATWYKLEPAGR